MGEITTLWPASETVEQLLRQPRRLPQMTLSDVAILLLAASPAVPAWLAGGF
jgi:hypothetical protein